jgi:hypothetical protein
VLWLQKRNDNSVNTHFVGTVFLLVVFTFSGYSQHSVLSSGSWYKVSVKENGIHKMDYNFFKSLGVNPDQIDPKNIKLFTGNTGMLPQLNSAPRLVDLQEQPIFMAGEADGKFNSDDYVLFYGLGSDEVSYDLSRKIFSYKNNLYADKNFYFITIGSDPGKRLTISESISTASPIINQFDDFGYYENDKFNSQSSGRDWFGELFDSTPEMTIRFSIDGMVANSSIKLVSSVMAKAFDGASFKVFLNDNPLIEQVIGSVPNTSYGLKGRKAIDTVTFNATAVGAPSRTNQDFKFQYNKTSTVTSLGYLDYMLFSFTRKLALYGNQTIFRSAQSVANPAATFEISSVPSDALVWDVTNPFKPTIQTLVNTLGKISFTTSTQYLKTFVVFKNDGLSVPLFEGTVANQDLHALGDLDFLIITHPLFKTEADRLAAHRTTHDKLSTRVVTVGEIYNEYAGGKQDITAIRDFVKDVYYRGNKRLSNILLFGRCSYDYRDLGPYNTNFVPTYESINSLGPLETYSSDDYYTFMEPLEGEWGEYPTQDHTMDLGVGRLSVTTLEEAQRVVDKLIGYDTSSAVGNWQTQFVFVADDGDYNIHQGQAEQLAATVNNKYPEFNTQKIYLDAFKQITRPSGQISPETKTAINKAVKEGAVIVNYTGHGSEQVWMQERVLDDDVIKEWKNGPRYPLFVTATCEFGRHDNPSLISSGEKILLQKNGGGIGLVTSARPVYSSTNFSLNQAFYNALFVKSSGRYRTLGEIFKDTKNNSISGISNRNFSLLGDPSMRLAFPQYQTIASLVKTKNNSDTIRALSSVVVIGEIRNGTQKATDFSGTIEISLLDKETTLNTLGDENPVFAYTARNNALFKGMATVTKGGFKAEFIVPKNIDQQIGNAKLSMFAMASNGMQANGSLTTIKLGLTEVSTAVDTSAPEIKLFMGDSSYIDGGLVGPNTSLVAKLSDASGINISSRTEGKNLTVVLDDTATYVVNRYYLADKDTYKKGTVTFPLEGLSKGKHTIKFSASDTYNNSSTASIDFVVTDGNGIVVDQFYNYPNPFNSDTEEASIQFVHSRPGEDLEASLQIYDLHGQLHVSQQFTIPSSPYRVILTTWDGAGPSENKLSAGVYLALLTVRSLLDGSKNEQSTRLIILN